MPFADGTQILFCRAEIGEPPAIWVADSDGKNERLLTRGFQDLGADQPRWLPNPWSQSE
jgi:TolB protein